MAATMHDTQVPYLVLKCYKKRIDSYKFCYEVHATDMVGLHHLYKLYKHNKTNNFKTIIFEL